MDYLYENLTDERFQELCQTLISAEFPNSQIYPVGQPDGGRDAIVYSKESSKKEFLVFQMKFVRNPYQVEDVHKWLVKTMAGEVDKINKLIPDGAKTYYLLTNVKGTAHLDTGSIDKLNNLLSTSISIPAFCWWRDDLSRRFEKNITVKWSFPEVLNGQDILNLNLFQYLNENKERRESVLRAYLIDQYDMDNEVKFKQIELQNHLLDLFTDVPIQPTRYNEKNRGLRHALSNFTWNYRNRYVLVDDIFEPIESYQLGAAQFLLSSVVQKKIKKVLVEGGPGQGKSTISQYVCQIHRIRLLNKTTDLTNIPEILCNTPIAIPFKIDLRDIASWLERKNPYPGSISEEHFVKLWNKSLESFIAVHIFYHSKLEGFNSNDFIAICRHSAILIVFDGFDEIANIQLREEVIEFINRGISRIEENSNSLQVIITSRPAAFSNTVGFSTDLYPHFELTDLTASIRKEYVEKWIKSRKLAPREANAIRKLVEHKLEQPHLKDLAKSPMQLAILISLLNTRGESLPNKRTALYDSYIELFFNRESEKNSVIRDSRDLIIDIHQYLAWVLHSEAELYQNNGRIELDELKAKLKYYLQVEGHKTDIADKLFNVVKERVCALVSRVQGTFEFEVQPLREYFCAKHLYKTSPYSPQGKEKTGTKPDRFEAISKNLYWQNVVRFFAGCFDKGELPLLIQKLTELQEDPLLKYTNHSQILTSQLLSDWVFTQYPLLLKNVVKIILQSISAGAVLNQTNRNSNNEPILIPAECGRNEVIEECFEQLVKFPPSDYAFELIGIINNNPSEKITYWQKHLKDLDGEKLSRWLEYGYFLQIIYLLKDDILVSILNEDKNQLMKRLQVIIDGNKLDLINNHICLKEELLEGMLNAEISLSFRRYQESSVQFLSFITNTHLLKNIHTSRFNGIPFKDLANHINGYFSHDLKQETQITEFNINDKIDQSISHVRDECIEILDETLTVWKSKLEPWEKLISTLSQYFGTKTINYLISIIAAGIKSKDERCEEASNFDDISIPLCRRIRYARLKSGNHTWWKKTLENTSEIDFAMIVCMTWATPKTLVELYPIFLKAIAIKSDFELRLFANKYKKVSDLHPFTSIHQKFIKTWLSKNSVDSSFIYLLSLRFEENLRFEFVYKFLQNFNRSIPEVLNYKLEYLIKTFLLDPKKESILMEIKTVYSQTKQYVYRTYVYRSERYFDFPNIPIDYAKKIMNESRDYPQILATMAERICRMYAYKKAIPVGKIAQEQKWFELC